MLIRAANPADIPQIIALAGQSETAAHWSAREYDALFDQEAPKRAALVAVDDQQSAVIAFAIARCMADEWELENIVVALSSRRLGIAQQLVQRLKSDAQRSGAGCIILEVREFNASARQLYAKLGFTESGHRRDYYDNPREDALLLRLELQSGDKTP
jgi:ribosomal-protein-alanine acetyltransferase